MDLNIIPQLSKYIIGNSSTMEAKTSNQSEQIMTMETSLIK